MHIQARHALPSGCEFIIPIQYTLSSGLLQVDTLSWWRGEKATPGAEAFDMVQQIFSTVDWLMGSEMPHFMFFKMTSSNVSEGKLDSLDYKY